ncbi:hypothetical protein [Nocardiopsis sp. CNT312]|uniref:hypothetical protein n=1 Tax=Nocardiopsis sp. CNT312 TaxID=1137268 RepID=UPI0004B70EB3|nr:hypothetical protein [Nocardiopsis sp. CNT312]
MSDTPFERTEHYAFSTSTPVRYQPVTRGETVIAYLWASTTEDAASCLMVLASAEPIERLRTAAQWAERLGRARSEGLTALQALERWHGAPEDPVAGGTGRPPGEVAALEELYEIANPGHPHPEPVPEEPADGPGGRWGDLAPFTLDRRTYHPDTDAAVRYAPVSDGEQVVGYLWAAETDDAASFIATPRSGAAGSRAKSAWIMWMVDRRSEEVSPLEAFELAADQPPHGSAIPPGTEAATAASLRELERIAWS